VGIPADRVRRNVPVGDLGGAQGILEVSEGEKSPSDIELPAMGDMGEMEDGFGWEVRPWDVVALVGALVLLMAAAWGIDWLLGVWGVLRMDCGSDLLMALRCADPKLRYGAL